MQTRALVRRDEDPIETCLIAFGDDLFTSLPAYEVIHEEVIREIEENDKIEYFIDEGAWPSDLVALLVTNVIYEMLSTGSFHVYHGVLGDEGKALLETYILASDIRMSSGSITEEERDADIASVRESIAECG